MGQGFKQSILSKSNITEIISILVVILFLYTGLSKLIDISIFRKQIGESPILEPIAPLIAWGLPLLEFIISLLLITPRYRLKGLYASLFLMIIFTLYVAVLMIFETNLPCSCGGIIELLSWKDHLIFNISYIILIIIGIILYRKNIVVYQTD